MVNIRYKDFLRTCDDVGLREIYKELFSKEVSEEILFKRDGKTNQI